MRAAALLGTILVLLAAPVRGEGDPATRAEAAAERAEAAAVRSEDAARRVEEAVERIERLVDALERGAKPATGRGTREGR